MIDIKDIIHTCFHCGNTGLLKFVGKTEWKDDIITKDEFGKSVNYEVILRVNA